MNRTIESIFETLKEAEFPVVTTAVVTPVVELVWVALGLTLHGQFLAKFEMTVSQVTLLTLLLWAVQFVSL